MVQRYFYYGNDSIIPQPTSSSSVSRYGLEEIRYSKAGKAGLLRQDLEYYAELRWSSFPGLVKAEKTNRRCRERWNGRDFYRSKLVFLLPSAV